MKLHLAQEYPEQTTDGIGIRYAVYTQGCRGGLWGEQLNHCPGCHNPETHSCALDAPDSYFLDLDDLIKKMRGHKLSWGRLTLCGGDPIWQAPACIELITKLKKLKPDFNVWAYTGLTFEFIKKSSTAKNHWQKYLAALDVLVDGPFILSQRDISLPWRGSPNQRVINVPESLTTGKIVFSEYN
jgi:anaerobic ribonucleoside-triphosphate reductase activating protein